MTIPKQLQEPTNIALLVIVGAYITYLAMTYKREGRAQQEAGRKVDGYLTTLLEQHAAEHATAETNDLE